MEEQIQSQVSLMIGKYGWLFLVGVLTLLFRGTIEKFVSGLFIFMGNDYNEDDVVEVDGKPGRIVRCGMWSTTFFTYDVRDCIIVGGSKFVVPSDKLKDLKIEIFGFGIDSIIKFKAYYLASNLLKETAADNMSEYLIGILKDNPNASFATIKDMIK